MYKLIALDMDGTLLNSRKELPEDNIKAVRAAVDKGIKVVICSGRIYSGAKVFARRLGIREPMIVCNGALVRDFNSEEIIMEDILGLEECLGIAGALKREGIYHHAYVEDSMYTIKLGYGSAFYSSMNQTLPPEERIDVRVIRDFSDVFTDGSKGAYKFVVYDPDTSELQRVREIISQIPRISIQSSNYDNFEVMKEDVSKGNALSVLAERLGIDRSEIIAVGDNENDLSMIEYAGLGVAMGNAEKEVKEIAGYVTCDNDSCGVAEVIKEFML